MSDPTNTALAALAAFPDQLKQQIAGLDDAAIRYRPNPSEWSIVEIIGHIIDVSTLWPSRIRQMLATEHPTLAAVDPAWVTQRDYQNKQPSFLLITLGEQRAEFVPFLRGLRPAQLERTGQHPTRGALNVAQAVAALADHDRIHTEQIAANIAAYQQQS